METQGIPLRQRPTDLRALLNSTMAVMRAQAAAADVALNVTIADDVPAVVRLDGAKVAWAVANLVGNALRYVRSGSRRVPGGTIHVETIFDPAASSVRIVVRDDGPGMPRAKLQRLFDHDDVQGPSALGLLLVQDIVAAHGGRIDVESTTDSFAHGTSVMLTLPTG
jgi:signal transduction histidine kinase